MLGTEAPNRFKLRNLTRQAVSKPSLYHQLSSRSSWMLFPFPSSFGCSENIASIAFLAFLTPAPSVQLSRDRLQLKSLKPGSGNNRVEQHQVIEILTSLKIIQMFNTDVRDCPASEMAGSRDRYEIIINYRHQWLQICASHHKPLQYMTMYWTQWHETKWLNYYTIIHCSFC